MYSKRVNLVHGLNQELINIRIKHAIKHIAIGCRLLEKDSLDYQCKRYTMKCLAYALQDSRKTFDVLPDRYTLADARADYWQARAVELRCNGGMTEDEVNVMIDNMERAQVGM